MKAQTSSILDMAMDAIEEPDSEAAAVSAQNLAQEAAATAGEAQVSLNDI